MAKQWSNRRLQVLVPQVADVLPFIGDILLSEGVISGNGSKHHVRQIGDSSIDNKDSGIRHRVAFLECLLNGFSGGGIVFVFHFVLSKTVQFICCFVAGYKRQHCCLIFRNFSWDGCLYLVILHGLLQGCFDLQECGFVDSWIELLDIAPPPHAADSGR